MNKKIISLLLSALALGALSTYAQSSASAPAADTAPAPALAPAPESTYAITVDFPYTTKYVFRGVELGEASLQPAVKLAAGDFYVGIWSSLPLTKNWETEIDFYAGYGFKLSEGWTLDAGATVYYYPGLDVPGADKATFEGYLGVNGTLGVLTTGTYAYYDFTLKAFTMQEALGYSVVVNPKTSVNFLATLGYVTTDAGSDYTYYGFGMTVPYKLTDSTTLTVGGQYADHNIDGLKGNHFWGTIGLTASF